MNPDKIDLKRLENLLEQERAFLLEGDLEGLGTLLPLKEELVETLLADEETNRNIIMPLEEKMRRNQLLIDGALDGIRTVAARLAALRQVRSALDTYDAQGRKRSIPTPVKPQVEKRALPVPAGNWPGPPTGPASLLKCRTDRWRGLRSWKAA
jgi:hypothetical protein